jgi:hypothetical protein
VAFFLGAEIQVHKGPANVSPQAHLDSGEGATNHALLNPEVQTRSDQGS